LKNEGGARLLCFMDIAAVDKRAAVATMFGSMPFAAQHNMASKERACQARNGCKEPKKGGPVAKGEVGDPEPPLGASGPPFGEKNGNLSTILLGHLGPKSI
jgi:hypothetical protein